MPFYFQPCFVYFPKTSQTTLLFGDPTVNAYINSAINMQKRKAEKDTELAE
jgi:hypothetical protein